MDALLQLNIIAGSLLTSGEYGFEPLPSNQRSATNNAPVEFSMTLAHAPEILIVETGTGTAITALFMTNGSSLASVPVPIKSGTTVISTTATVTLKSTVVTCTTNTSGTGISLMIPGYYIYKK